MDQVFCQQIRKISNEGFRRYAEWDATLFHDLCKTYALVFWQNIQEQTEAEKLFLAYLKLLQEALGKGYISQENLHSFSEDSADTQNLFELFLLKILPTTIQNVPNKERVFLLSRAWNLAEGIQKESVWLRHYIHALSKTLDDLTQIESFLHKILSPILTPQKPSNWQGPFQVSFLNLRNVWEEFLPGNMHLAAPSVLCIHERNSKELFMGVFLHPQKCSEIIGLTPCLGQIDSVVKAPEFTIKKEQITLGENTIQVPFFREIYTHLFTEGGFLVLSALDSQRLWIVES